MWSDPSLYNESVFAGLNFITLPKIFKISSNFTPDWPLSTTGKLFEKVILKIVQRHIAEKACLMQASLVSVPVTTRHFNVRSLRTTLTVVICDLLLWPGFQIVSWSEYQEIN
jgi:hypothetical protein